jgi:hypothetical protein
MNAGRGGRGGARGGGKFSSVMSYLCYFHLGSVDLLSSMILLCQFLLTTTPPFFYPPTNLN